jgi:hypothetical protein
MKTDLIRKAQIPDLEKHHGFDCRDIHCPTNGRYSETACIPNWDCTC